MPEHPDRRSEYHEYLAWDVPTRLFHWINALAVLGLIATGLEILTGNLLGLSPEGKIALKSVHVLLGYVMAANLLWRFVWAFFGNRYARWRSILPGGAGFAGALRAYVASFLTGEPQQYIGHNPLARIGVAFLFLLLLVQMATGLVLAGTDLFWPPFGRIFAGWVAAPGVDPGLIHPGASELIDKAAYESMRAFRAPFVEIHEVHLLFDRDRRRASPRSRGGHGDSRRRQHHVGDVHRPKDPYEKTPRRTLSKSPKDEVYAPPTY